MTIDISTPGFVEYCKTADPFEVAEKSTCSNIRGLDKLALSNLASKNRLPHGVRNMLIAYFFQAFSNEVYHRNDLGRLYDYWAANQVSTMAQAEKMMEEDLHEVMKQLK